MGNLLNSIKQRFRQKDVLVQLIVINIAVFLVLKVASVITQLFLVDSLDILKYIGVPSNIELLIRRPWTLISYMFVHEGVLHILFNMLLLYWFGQLFLTYFSSKNLGSLYFLGGIAGAVLYLVAFNVIPLYIGMGQASMIGASASVMAIIFAVAFYNPNLKMNLLFIGSVKIIYIAIFFFIIDFISLNDKSNPGGHVAHIGGALMGFVFAKQYLKGKDITRWMSSVIDWVMNVFKPRPKIKVTYNKRDKEYNYNRKRNEEWDDIDKILDKIKASGYSSLSENEKKRLFDAGKK